MMAARGDVPRSDEQRRGEAELRVYDGGHAFFVQDRAALPDLVAYVADP